MKSRQTGRLCLLGKPISAKLRLTFKTEQGWQHPSTDDDWNNLFLHRVKCGSVVPSQEILLNIEIYIVLD